MCLSFIERFGSADAPNAFHQHIEQIFRYIHAIALHQKTAKAIKHQRGSIEEGLSRIQQNTSITNNIKCTELLDMIKSTLSLGGYTAVDVTSHLARPRYCNAMVATVYHTAQEHVKGMIG